MVEEANYNIYTPKNIADIMIEKILNSYFLTGNKKERLDKIKICDISCGSGNLLIPALEKLLMLSKKIYGEFRFYPSWISGFDINDSAIYMAKENIKQLLKKYDVKFSDDDINIQNCNALMLENEKYNVMIGNPPYLGEKNNKELFHHIKNSTFGKKYYEAKMDYFYFFIEKAVELLEDDGFLIYLTTYYWLRADSGNILRNTLKENGNFLDMDIYDNSLFQDADGQHNIIFLWEKSLKDDKIVKVSLPDKDFNIYNSQLYDKDNKIILGNEKELNLNNKIINNSNFILQDLVNINQGIISGYDKAFIFNEYDERFKEYLKPFYKNKDIHLYSNSKNQYWILYMDKDAILTPEIEKYLLPYKEKLENRREVKEGRIKWWQLQWAREEHIFNNPKILVRQRCKTNQFSYDESSFYGSADIYFITKKMEDVSLMYILGYMNSSIFLEWFKLNGKFKGINYEFYATPLKNTPIYYPQSKKEIEYIEKLVKEQLINFSEDIQDKINAYFVNIYK